MKNNISQIRVGKSLMILVMAFGFFNVSAVQAQSADLVCNYNDNLIINGSFETPTLPVSGYGWDVFPSEVDGLVWKVEWLDATGAPAVPMLEIQNGYTARNGSQYAELDSNWTVAPGTTYNGEATSVAISQTISTKIGETYLLSWSFSALPYYDTLNKLEVLVDGVIMASNSANGVNLVDTDWNDDKITFVASATTTTITFRDAGTVDSFGTLLDNVCMSEVGADDTTSNPATPTISRSGTIIAPGGTVLVIDEEIKDLEEVEITEITDLPLPEPLVLGEQVSIVPVGAANTGAGGTSNSGVTLTLNNLLIMSRRQNLLF